MVSVPPSSEPVATESYLGPQRESGMGRETSRPSGRIGDGPPPAPESKPFRERIRRRGAVGSRSSGARAGATQGDGPGWAAWRVLLEREGLGLDEEGAKHPEADGRADTARPRSRSASLESSRPPSSDHCFGLPSTPRS
jgi:hypothetical protein